MFISIWYYNTLFTSVQLFQSNHFFSEMDKLKSYLVDALVRLACAQADIIIQRNKAPVETADESTTPPTQEDDDPDSTTRPTHATGHVTLQGLDETWVELLKWTEMSDSKVRLSGNIF